MKKILALVLVLVIVITGCSSDSGKDDGKFKVGIVQYIEQKALDSVREGFEEKIKELGVDIDIDYQNAQGDVGVARTICEKFVQDDVDLIFAIATPAAQAALSVTEEIPIVFSAVTDPVDAELVESLERPGKNATGTTDKVDMESQLKLFKGIDENIETIGIIYSQDEANSLAQIKELEEIGPKLGFKMNTIAIQNISDLPQASQSLVKESDGVYVIADNKIASSISLLAKVLIDSNTPSVCAEEAHVKGGCLISEGISYFDLGKQSFEMALDILENGKDPGEMEVQREKNVEKKINLQTLKELGLDENMEVFKDAIVLDGE